MHSIGRIFASLCVYNIANDVYINKYILHAMFLFLFLFFEADIWRTMLEFVMCMLILDIKLGVIWKCLKTFRSWTNNYRPRFREEYNFLENYSEVWFL